MEVLNYPSLLMEYRDSMATLLRGFKPSVDYLDCWVPDEDHSRSILNIIEAAELAGRSQVSIWVDQETLNLLNTRELAKMVQKIGKITISEVPHKGADIVVEIAGNSINSLDKKPLQETIHSSSYRANISKLMAERELKYEGEMIPEQNGYIVSAKIDGVRLQVKVNPHSHTIIDAKHSGSTSLDEKAVLDLLCEMSIDTPIQEASDHGMNKVEYFLRGNQPPVPGIVTPKNANPIFARPLSLIHQAYQSYCTSSKHKDGDNFYDCQAGASWRKLSMNEKLETITQFLKTKGEKTFPETREISVSRIDGPDDIRIFFSWQGETSSKDKASILMQLERLIRDSIDPRLEVFMEEKKDGNRLRRL